MHKVSEIVAELKISYAAEIEVIENYLAQASNLEGPRGEPIKEWLDLEVQTGLSHARRLARRISALEGKVPVSPELSRLQKESPAGATDVDSVLLGAIKTADTAITQYEKIIQLCDSHDFVTLDLVIELLVDERERKQQLKAFANSR
jgi:ferritin-like protein